MFGKHKKRITPWIFLLVGVFLVASHTTEAAVKDSDADGLTDQAETNTYHTNPLNPDSDNDGASDSEEILNRSNPLDNTDYPQRNTQEEIRHSITMARLIGGGGIIALFLLIITTFAILPKTKKSSEAPLSSDAPD